MIRARVRPFRVTILAAPLTVLTLASSASAECAWVLWQFAPNYKEAWNVVGAFSREAGGESACGRSAKGANDEAKANDQAKGIARYTCLPDTVDPRGPKASGR